MNYLESEKQRFEILFSDESIAEHCKKIDSSFHQLVKNIKKNNNIITKKEIKKQNPEKQLSFFD